MNIKAFSSIITVFTVLLACLITSTAFAQELPLFDDCVDMSVAESYSEEIYPSVIDEESRSAYDNDYTMFMRKTLTAASVTYEIPEGKYPVFNTYFRQNEEIAHFGFETSLDGNEWTKAEPKINIKNVENWKWIPVTYTLKNISDDARFVRITFSDKNSVEWSPMLASVQLGYKTITKTGFNDCVNTEYQDVTAKLKSLGFITGFNEYEYHPYDMLSRAELAVFCARVLNIKTEYAENIFPDVEKEHYAAGAISALYNSKIINGDENGLFNPDMQVTYTEAAKLLVCSLGFGIEAEENGGYPIGYTTVAKRLGVLDGLSVADLLSPVSRGDAAVMLGNLLDSDLMYQTEYGEYQRYEKGNILSVYHDIETVDGIISSADGLSVISDANSGENIAVINDVSYKMSKFDLSYLLGVSVRAYIDKNSKEILYAENKKSEITNISAECEPVIKDCEIIYTQNDKEKKIVLDGNTRIVYNGRYQTRAAMLDEFKIKSGDITLIENKGDGSDVILIWEYKSLVVSSDGYITNPISSRIGDTINFDLSKAEKTLFLLNGEEVKLDEIFLHRGDIVSVAQSDDKKVIYISVSSGGISGKVEYYNKTARIIMINGNEYKLTADCVGINGEISVGKNITAYIDVNGRVFATEPYGESEYAYLIQAVNNSVFNDEITIQLLRADGTIKEYSATTKTKLNGYANKLTDITFLSPQLIRIKISNDSIISAIETAAFGENLIGTSEFVCNHSSVSKYYGGSMRVFASKYRFDINTPIFLIPKDKMDKDKYKITNINSLYSDFAYDVSIYDVNDEYDAGAAVICTENSDERIVASYDNVGVIKNSSVFNNAKGEPCLMLSVYSKGEEREIYFDNEGGIDHTNRWLNNYTNRETANGNNPFKTGEVIQYYSDSESHCKSFRMLLTSDIIFADTYYENNVADYGPLTKENYFSELYSVFGEVKIKTTDKLVVFADDKHEILRTIPLNGAGVYVYYTDRNKLIKTDSTDISAGDKIFARMIYADTTDILIVR